MKNNLVLVKWGGSLITVKDSSDPTPRMSVITDLAKKLAGLHMKPILIHGAGSFGHPLASEYSLADGQTRSKRQMEAVSETIDRIKQLNKIVFMKKGFRYFTKLHYLPYLIFALLINII